MKYFIAALEISLVLWLANTAICKAEDQTGASPTSHSVSASTGEEQLPYVYTQWKHFTVKDGLPNDHIFAVKADSSNVWVGSEDGLARIDKKSLKIKSWKEEDGLPWRVVSALDYNPKTGELWLGLFGGGLARFSGGRFDHWHAGASRYNTVTGEWTIYTEKNSPMEEIWNYGVSYNDGKVYLGIWGSGVLEFDVATERWKDYLDPDGEMEIDLYRDDGIVHVITTGNSYIDGILWVSTYFGMSRYDGRYWRGYYAHETGLPSDFGNAVKGRNANEAWFATDKGIGVVADFATDTWVTYTLDPNTLRGKAVVTREQKILEVVDMPKSIPHNYALWVEFDGDDTWVGTSKGVGWAIGSGYYKGLKKRPPHKAGSDTYALIE